MLTITENRSVAAPGRTEGALSAVRLVQSSIRIRFWAKVTLVLLVLAVTGMTLLPWQQSAKGTGNVVAYVPQERQQTVMSPVKGIVESVGEGLVEGTTVREGDVILELVPAAANMRSQLDLQRQDLANKLSTSEVKAEAYRLQVTAYSDARDFAVSAAQQMVEAAEAKLLGAQDMVAAYIAKELQAKLNLDRQVGLYEKGLKPQVEIEKLRKEYDVACAELEKAKRDVTAAEREVAAKKQELEHKRSESQAKIDYARAMEQDALGQQNTAAKELRDLEMKLSELERLTIRAPRDGTIFRMPVFERGQVIKEGTELFTIVPQTDDLAVEMWIAGNDVPLVRVGDDVRLQFEGWPAVQFAGWPSVAVGTFPGKVAAIDQSDNGKGKFRIQVRPPTNVAWPSERYLRQGVRANGWVMLSQVRLGYEVWRQLNGFPPIVSDAEPEKSKDDKKSKVKLPK